VIKANNFDAEFLGINYPALTSRSKLLLIFMMFLLSYQIINAIFAQKL